MTRREKPHQTQSTSLIKRYRSQWESLGVCDPYWAVITDPAGKNGRWDKEKFFALGEREICAVLEHLDNLHKLRGSRTALDFGCGVGRLSRALATRFDRVIAVDISEAMLVEARVQNSSWKNIEFVHNPFPNLSFLPDGCVDFIYSNIVLQHVHPTLQAAYIADFCRVLASGGIAVFQTPAKHDLTSVHGWMHYLAGNRIMNVLRRILYGKDRVMEVHVLPSDRIHSILECGETELLQVEPNDSSGPGFCAFRYYALKSPRH